ncbi:Hpt domain-containing protein [Woodsholea maritima]|uniref:Hpt domain-containing protein n=1 Tax=Woodsholea maritima TaxID=240237 RepID=UPI00037BF2ED|nr:Hpt domain-containing protein [Woodsholea maritima]
MGDFAILDRQHLARYTGGDAALEAELFGLFLRQAETCIERLKIAQNDQAWRDAAHTLKGSARGIGAMALGHACEIAEQCVDDARGDALIAIAREVHKVSTCVAEDLAKCA